MSKRILVVDDDQVMQSTLQELLESEGYEADTTSGGLIVLEKLDHSCETYDVVLRDTRPLEERQEEVALVGIAEALVTLVEARDYSTGYHSHQVADLALQLALALGLPAAEAQMIALAGQLHDIGKVAVPDHILLKPGVLTEEEWELMRTHAVVGADVISRIPTLRLLVPVIRAHHERWDGQGYPDHLAAEAIPLGARILAVVDAYQAMTMHRPYRQGRAPAVALAELCQGAGSQFDPQVVEHLMRLLRQRGEHRDSV